jgi:hypothetical protein
MLSAALSLAIAMLVGLAIAVSGGQIDAAAVAAGLFAVCVPLAGGWAVRARRGSAPEPAVNGTHPPARRPGAALRWLAAVPAVLLTVLLVVQVVAVARYRTPDSYYTELSAGPARADVWVVVAHSRERTTVRFRFEETVDGSTVSTTEFWLSPGGRMEFAVARREAGRVEVRLYRAGEGPAYRRLTVQPGPQVTPG